MESGALTRWRQGSADRSIFTFSILGAVDLNTSAIFHVQLVKTLDIAF